MPSTHPRYTKEEFAKLGDLIYERDVIPMVDSSHEGSFVVIDIESGEYEVDKDERVASNRLLVRCPDAQIWLRRIGFRHTRRFGVRPQETE